MVPKLLSGTLAIHQQSMPNTAVPWVMLAPHQATVLSGSWHLPSQYLVRRRSAMDLFKVPHLPPAHPQCGCSETVVRGFPLPLTGVGLA
jgi:hypothetical protein